jgi:hypothetical protein
MRVVNNRFFVLKVHRRHPLASRAKAVEWDEAAAFQDATGDRRVTPTAALNPL